MRKNAKIFKKYKKTNHFFWVFKYGSGYQKPNPKPNKYPTKLTDQDSF